MNPWWLGLSPAQATVRCGEHEHRIRWEAGELRALDHSDPEGERALAALGGQRCTCVDLLDAWERHRDDARVLVLASRGPTDQLTASEAPTAQLGVARPQVVGGNAALLRARSRRMRGVRSTSRAWAIGGPAGWTAYAPAGRVSKRVESENELIALLSLTGGLQDRLVATVAAAWRERLGQSDRALTRVRPQLRAALHGRVFAAMRGWLGGTGLESQMKMITEGQRPKLVSESDIVLAELPFGWLVDVWAKGLATIWGRFCLAATTDDGQTWRLTTVGPDLGAPALVTLQLPDAATAAKASRRGTSK